MAKFPKGLVFKGATALYLGLHSPHTVLSSSITFSVVYQLTFIEVKFHLPLNSPLTEKIIISLQTLAV